MRCDIIVLRAAAGALSGADGRGLGSGSSASTRFPWRGCEPSFQFFASHHIF